VTRFYIGCHRPTTTFLLYLGLGQAVNGALAELKQNNSIAWSWGKCNIEVIEANYRISRF